MSYSTRIGAAAAGARTILLAGLLSAGALASQAAETCRTADAKGAIACSAGMDDARVREIAIVQERSQWCWAASISMIFANYGYTLPQETIVKDVHGSVADVNAESGEVMTSALQRHWRDAANHEFAVSSRAGDVAASRYDISNDAIATELINGRPLLIGTRGHAMVLVHANYERRSNGVVVITGGTVIDPLPGKGVRRLARNEMGLTYVAAVQVSSMDSKASAQVESDDLHSGRSGGSAGYAGSALDSAVTDDR
ncbi:MAG: C39 family peptidase [Massilia sp.]|nr:C39 family peptidase [Massilia sp.]